MSKKYVIGHRNPDTDAIASAMAYAELKQLLGEDVEACRLGTLNEETKYATKYFDIEAPNLIKDARSKLADIELDKTIEISEDDSCNSAFNLVVKTNNRTLFVCEDHRLLGVLSISDLTSIRLMDDANKQALLSKSNLELIAKDISGTILNKAPFDSNGRVSIFTSSHTSLNHEKDILLLDNQSILLKALASKPSLVVFVGEINDLGIINQYAKENVALIVTNTKLENIVQIIYEAIPVKLVMSEKITYCHSNEYVEDIASKIINTRFRCYPVLDENDVLVGSVSRFHLFNYKKKQFVLVDHSSKSHTIENIDLAEIVEVIDHHQIGDIQTRMPINYRNETCGSTCSIIYRMYKENNLLPSKKIAGMMLSAIISDTLFFISSTTKPIDFTSAEELARIAEVDIKEYANQLLSASIDLYKADINDLISRDLKEYVFNGYKVAVGQTNYKNISDIQVRENEFKDKLAKYQIDNGFDLLIMMFTHVYADGAMFLFFGPKAGVMHEILERKIDENAGYDSEIMSRKQQLIPKISTILERY